MPSSSKHDAQWVKDAFKELHQSLKCSICESLLSNPSTLSCTHSFCHECILEYSKINWTCPRCNTPFVTAPKANPQLKSVVASYQEIIETLNDKDDVSCVNDEELKQSISQKRRRSKPTKPESTTTMKRRKL